MANAFIPRDRVHQMSEEIGNNVDDHQAALSRLLKDQRRISRFFEENSEELQAVSGSVGVYLLGVICRMFDMQGGRMRKATWAQVREAEAHVGGLAAKILPVDEGFGERFRSVPRAQPHILDEAYMSLFERADDLDEEEAELAEGEALKLLFLLWVSTEVLDANWQPGRQFAGEEEYSYVRIEPTADA